MEHDLKQMADRIEAIAKRTGFGGDSDGGAILANLNTVIDLDRECHMTLAYVSDIVSNIEIPEPNIEVFKNVSASALDDIRGMEFPKEADEIRRAVTAMVDGGGLLSLMDIFTVISIVVTLVSMCVAKLPQEEQKSVVAKLDSLLSLKLEQLKMLNIIIVGGVYRDELS